MHHRQLLGVSARDAVNDVKGEVEFVLAHELDPAQRALLVLGGADEFFAQKRQLFFARRRRGLGLGQLVGRDDHRLLGLAAGHNHGQKYAVLPVHSDHAVRSGALIEDAVALVQNLLVIAHAHAHRALDNKVKFLTGVGGGVDGLVLELLGILIRDPVGRGQLLAEQRRHVLDGDAVLAGRDGAAAAPRDHVARELCAVAFEQVGQFHAERERALMHKGERQVGRAGLVGQILFLRDLGLLRHLLRCEADDLPHLTDTLRHLQKLICRCLIGHDKSSPDKQKARLKNPLEASCSNINPWYHSNCGRKAAASEPNSSYPLTRADERRLLTHAFGPPTRK